MKSFLFATLIFCSMLATSCNGQNDNQTIVLLHTTAGDIRIALYNDTPIHRDNFIKNVKDGMYNDVTFHRVIRNFMIQTGDPDTRQGNFPKVEPTDSNELGPSIEGEILFPCYIHQKGVVAAAREGDDINPDKRSSKYQFYIVTGKFQTDEQLSELEYTREQTAVAVIYDKLLKQHAAELENFLRLRQTTKYEDALSRLRDQAQDSVDNNPPARISKEQRRLYRSRGGAPWLDGEYTIFGEVIEGMKVVSDIEKTRTDRNDKPLRDIRIISASIE